MAFVAKESSSLWARLNPHLRLWSVRPGRNGSSSSWERRETQCPYCAVSPSLAPVAKDASWSHWYLRFLAWPQAFSWLVCWWNQQPHFPNRLGRLLNATAPPWQAWGPGFHCEISRCKVSAWTEKYPSSHEFKGNDSKRKIVRDKTMAHPANDFRSCIRTNLHI